MNEVAAAVWERIETLPDRQALMRYLRGRYRGVDDRTLSADLDILLDQWQRDGWIEWQIDPVFQFREEPWPA